MFTLFIAKYKAGGIANIDKHVGPHNYSGILNLVDFLFPILHVRQYL